MKLISKTKYTHRYFDEAQQLIISKWQRATESLNEVLYKKEMLAAVEAVKQYKPTLFMVYAQEFRYIIAPELQTWTSQYIAKPIACLGVRKFAYVIPQEYIAGLSVEQTVQEANECEKAALYELRYFREAQKGLQWLLDNTSVPQKHHL